MKSSACGIATMVPAVLVAEVPIDLHRQRTAVLVAQPTAQGWDVDAGFPSS